MTAPTFFKHVIGEREVDVFIHTWSRYDHRGESWATNHGGTQFVDPNEIAQLYDPVDLIVEQSPDEPPGPSPASMFRKIYECDILRQRWEERTGIGHQIVMRLRPDHLFIDGFPWNDYDVGSLHIPHGEDHGGMNDQIAWGPPDVMQHYCSIGKRTVNGHPEAEMGRHLGNGARRPVVGMRIVRMSEADQNGFVKKIPVPLDTYSIRHYQAPSESRPVESEHEMATIARPMREFWTPTRYAGDTSGVDMMVAGLTEDIIDGTTLIVEATDRLRPFLSSKFKIVSWVYPFLHDDLHLDVPDDSYDNVLACTLQFIPSRKGRNRILGECFRTLHPGGLLSLQMGFGPGRFTPYMDDGPVGGNTLCHVLLEDEGLLLDDLKAIGFEIESHKLKQSGPGDGQAQWLFVRAKRLA